MQAWAMAKARVAAEVTSRQLNQYLVGVAGEVQPRATAEVTGGRSNKRVARVVEVLHLKA